jgi:hypothetical protein
MKLLSSQIPGYTYGTSAVTTSPISLHDLELLKQCIGWTEETERYRRLAGEVLADQTEDLVKHWRAILASHPHLARYSLSPQGQPIPHYSNDSGLRFQQWVLDTCQKPYDQDWLNYQQEIALRHTHLKKNKTDGVDSAPFIPLRYLLAFAAQINETTRPFLAAHGHSAQEVDKMHQAWCKAVLLQVTLWSYPYATSTLAPDEW